MSSADDGTYYVELKGATEEELRRGLAAARTVFERAGVDPEACASASFKREGRCMGSRVKVSKREHDLADLWWEGAEAAWSVIGHDYEDRAPNFGLWQLIQEHREHEARGTPLAPAREHSDPHYSFPPLSLVDGHSA
jgi:hypothetical protein